MTALGLDRMTIEEVGANPVRLAEAIHHQLGDRPGAVPVADIAKALDIVQIRIEPLTNFEGALVTTTERDIGSILVNQRSNPRRRRFTIGHELLHFLNPWHQPTSPEGFWCGQQDMIANQINSEDRHQRQEAEANVFAIELLAPLQRIGPHLRGVPDLAAVLSMSDDLDISKEAASRRYASCHGDTLAVVFSRDNRFLYVHRSEGFPWVSLRKDLPLPALAPSMSESGLSGVEEADSDDWISKADNVLMTAQTLHQQANHAITLLRIVSTDEDDDDGGIDDTYERFSRFDAI